MMNNHLTHTPMIFKDKCIAWCHLIRLDKPIGIELLLYPTLWSLFLASANYGKLPSLKLVVIFGLGAIFMRSAGCAINDFADRKVDGQVARTKNRPLADGRLAPKTAVVTFIALALLSACLLLFLPVQVFYWSLIAVILAFIYPFMKRYTHLPQVVLAAAFGWAVPMAFVAVNSQMGQIGVGMTGWLMFIGYMCWTVAYDTQYALCDKNDDIKIGVKSTAILFEKLFGKYDTHAILVLQLIFMLIMGLLIIDLTKGSKLLMFNAFFTVPLISLFAHQWRLIETKERLNGFKAFLHNAVVGRYLFLMIVGICVVLYR